MIKKRNQESRVLRSSLNRNVLQPLPAHLNPQSPTSRGSTHQYPWDHSGGPKVGSKKAQNVHGSTVGGKEGSGQCGDAPGTHHVFLQGPD